MVLFRCRPARLAVLAGLISVAVSLLFVVPAQAQQAVPDHPDASCQATHVPVSLPGIGDARIYGQLCVPDGGSKADTVQLLVHGGTYDHNYFDWPQDPARYSYVDKALKAGYATFNVDRLGDGDSSHPPGALDTFGNGAEAMHQVIGKLRHGEIGGHAFSRVVWVGHSMGSLTAWFEAQRYHDVDAFVLTGILHNVKTTFASKLVNLVYPAMLDGKFRGKILDPGYTTSLPGTRGDTFYYRPRGRPGGHRRGRTAQAAGLRAGDGRDRERRPSARRDAQSRDHGADAFGHGRPRCRVLRPGGRPRLHSREPVGG